MLKQLLSASLASLILFATLPANAIEKPISLSDPKSLRQSAFESYLSGNFDKAKVYYEQAIDQTQKTYGPNSPFLADLYFELGTVSLELSKFSIASHYLPLAVEKRPNSRQARIKLAELYMLTGKEEEARVQLEAAQKAHPKAPEVQAAIVKWMIRQSQKARREEGNPQKEQVLAMASVSGSFYLHKLVESKPSAAAAAAHNNAKIESEPHQKKSTMSEGLARFAAPVTEKPAAAAAKQEPVPVVSNAPPKQDKPKEEKVEDILSSALNLKSRIFQPKKEETKAPPPVVVEKPQPKQAPKQVKKERAKPKVQPAVVATVKPLKTAAKRVEKVQQQAVVPASTGMEMMTYMPAMPVQMPATSGKRGKKGAFVPPPPPMIPSYSGAMPMAYPVQQMQQSQLRTTARMEEPKKKAKAPPSESSSASEAPVNSEDPEFILEWASVKKKGKKGAAKENKED